MKFVRFVMGGAAKAAEVGAVNDKVWASPPPGTKLLASYTCMGIAFPGALAPNTMVGISIIEAESAEGMVAVAYPLMLAGVTVWFVPVMEMPVAGEAEVEKKYRG